MTTTTANPLASESSMAPHIGYWDSRSATWRPWCEVYGDQYMPNPRPTPPTDEVCAGCFALAIGEIEDAT